MYAHTHIPPPHTCLFPRRISVQEAHLHTNWRGRMARANPAVTRRQRKHYRLCPVQRPRAAPTSSRGFGCPAALHARRRSPPRPHTPYPLYSYPFLPPLESCPKHQRNLLNLGRARQECLPAGANVKEETKKRLWSILLFSAVLRPERWC